ncbi:Zn-dependent hydrolase [Bacillus sp. FJAT-49705]|uniref:Zn-dependent hydrolase n=1 Tax=Cytobacillus citreus TaxID=2833586 RepID=A0ABS5NVP4_9BACI|nr:Zn-dependent hydrolase [Cytobacillus citreus]MBS4191893.1 Zn-dependent hydrolase [Cytobacillus citreus]
MNINKERLWYRLNKLAAIGRNEFEGITRLSFTEEEKSAKLLVSKWMVDAGLKVREDAMGNLIGRLGGKNPALPVVLIGSHIDSVFNGGIFDGPTGVLSGIEVLQTMKEKNFNPDGPVEVIAFTDEEGARFSSGMLGSLAVAGKLKEEELHQYRDQNEISIAEAMEKMGYNPELIKNAKRDPATIKAYLELHIEQGRVLENENLPVGVVEGIVGLYWLKVTLKGIASHAGSTPMNLRKDPLAAAASIMSFGEQLAKQERNLVITVGQMNVSPGGINIIPGAVELTFDIRDIQQKRLDRSIESLTTYISDVCNERKIEYEIEVLDRLSPAVCSDKIIEIISDSVKECNITPYKLPSGAAHDAMVMAQITDMAMIFVRSKEGISHNPKEWSEEADIALGAEVLYRTVLKLIKQKVVRN